MKAHLGVLSSTFEPDAPQILEARTSGVVMASYLRTPRHFGPR